jgi:uncharacterized protein YkwD
LRQTIVVLGGLLLAAASPLYGQSGETGRLHDMINQHREAVACPALAWHQGAAVVAQYRSADMDRRDYFDHTDPDGRTFIDELASAGIQAWGTIAENIALTQAGAESALELWVESPPHRRNLDFCAFTHQAIGLSSGYWTQILLAQPKRLGRGAMGDLP